MDVDLLARLVIGSKYVCLGLCNVYAGLMGELLVLLFEELNLGVIADEALEVVGIRYKAWRLRDRSVGILDVVCCFQAVVLEHPIPRISGHCGSLHAGSVAQ